MAKSINISEHLACDNYPCSGNSMIEVIQLSEGFESEFKTNINEVVYLVEGKLRYKFQDYPQYDVDEQQIFLLPTGGFFSYTALMDSVVLTMRLDMHIQLCENYQIEWLSRNSEKNRSLLGNEMRILDAKNGIRHFIHGLKDCIQEGIRCKYYFELKIREFFHLLLNNYTEDEIRIFLLPIISGDTVFSDYIRKNSHKYRTVEDLAESMCMSPKQFSKKFKTVFGNTAYDWMKKSKAQSIRREITMSQKPFKQIAVEYEFSSISTFAKFCKKELGNTPLRIRNGEIELS